MGERLWKKYHEAKENKKGFTLVELIVVLVIIGILAAILLPSLLRYIDRAKDKQIIANARTVYNAVTSGVAEEYGKQKPDIEAKADTLVQNLLKGENFNENANVNWFAFVDDKYQVIEVVYRDKTAKRQASLQITGDAADAGDWVTDTVDLIKFDNFMPTTGTKGWMIQKIGAKKLEVKSFGI